MDSTPAFGHRRVATTRLGSLRIGVDAVRKGAESRMSRWDGLGSTGVAAASCHRVHHETNARRRGRSNRGPARPRHDGSTRRRLRSRARGRVERACPARVWFVEHTFPRRPLTPGVARAHGSLRANRVSDPGPPARVGPRARARARLRRARRPDPCLTPSRPVAYHLRQVQARGAGESERGAATGPVSDPISAPRPLRPKPDVPSHIRQSVLHASDGPRVIAEPPEKR